MWNRECSAWEGRRGEGGSGGGCPSLGPGMAYCACRGWLHQEGRRGTGHVPPLCCTAGMRLLNWPQPSGNAPTYVCMSQA